MAWWPKALYDTCSLITIDKLLQIDADLEQHFVGITALAVSFTAGQMRAEVAVRIQARVTHVDLPSARRMAEILGAACLSSAIAEVDRLIYATAVEAGLSVVTSDKRLGKALKQGGRTVGNVATILNELVGSRKLKRSRCVELLVALAERNDLLLGKPDPKWRDMECHTFP